MIPRSFDSFIAVDWSGARGRSYDGIAIASCMPGRAAPVLVAPRGRRWSRADFVGWLVEQSQDEARILVGIDFAFALPAATVTTWLGPDYQVAELWDTIDRACADTEDFYGGDFADHRDRQSHFWRGGKRPDSFREHRRAAELACHVAGLGSPESPLKLVGAKQVGKGGLAGMRVLARLKRSIGDAFCVWPFDPIDRARIICVELYPRLFMRMALHGNHKVRTQAALDRCLEALDSESAGPMPVVLSDHHTDALVAAAGLRKIAADPAVWNPAGLDALARRAEGWVFGVP